MTADHKKYLMWAGLAVGGYFAVTAGVPWLIKQIGKAGSDTAKATGGAAAQTGGSVIGAALNAAPQALSSAAHDVYDYANSDANVLKPVAESIGGWLYDLFNPPKPVTLIKQQIVNGKRFNVYSDGHTELVK